jgi:phytoene desaturase
VRPREATGYRRYVDFVSTLYRHEMREFIDRNIDSPLSLLTPTLAKLPRSAASGASRPRSRSTSATTDAAASSRSVDVRGLSPYDALAIYAVIAYMDSVAGVFFPRGGMHAVPRALAGAAEKHGVDLRYGTEVTRVEMQGRRAVAVHTADGERIPADVVVLNPDLPVAYEELLGRVPRSVRRLKYSPSCFLLLAGSARQYPEDVHHNISFGTAWKQVFEEIIDGGRVMSDPSFLVSVPTASDPSLAPAGRSAYYVLFPTPNLDGPIDWASFAPRYRDQVVSHDGAARAGRGSATRSRSST